MRWCSVDSVAFHSFVWPHEARDAKSFAKTLFTNHCNWRDVLIVPGRCFCSHKSCHAASPVLENLLWHWSKTDRPYLVYKEGSKATVGGDLMPGWLSRRCWGDSCQCNFVGRNKAFNRLGWHHPGSLYSNIKLEHAFGEFESAYPARWKCKPCRYYGGECDHPRDSDTKHSLNEPVAIASICAALRALEGDVGKRRLWEQPDHSKVCYFPPGYDPRKNQPPRCGNPSRKEELRQGTWVPAWRRRREDFPEPSGGEIGVAHLPRWLVDGLVQGFLGEADHGSLNHAA